MDTLPASNRVLHVIYSMKRGGAESLLLDSVCNTSELESGHFSPVVVCWHHEGSLGSELRKANVPLFVLNRRTRPLWLAPLLLFDFLGLLRSITKIARETDAKIVHGHLVDSAFIAAIVSSRIGAKSAATIYSNHVVPMSIKDGTLKHRIWMALTRWSFRHLDRLISISGDVTETLIGKFGAWPQNIAEVPVAVAPVRPKISKAQARALFGLSNDEICLVFTGRLVANKNQTALISMVKELVGKGLKVRLLLVGDGPDKERLQREIQATGTEGHVTLLGLYPDLSEVLAAADIFVTASLSEGVSLALLEAMTLRIPIVSTRSEGNAELLKNAVGYLVDEADIPALANAVASLASDPSARKQLADKAERFYQENHSQEVRRAAELAVYSNLLKGAQ